MSVLATCTVEPAVSYLKATQRIGRDRLAHRAGDNINAALAFAGYNFRLLLRWLTLCCADS